MAGDCSIVDAGAGCSWAGSVQFVASKCAASRPRRCPSAARCRVVGGDRPVGRRPGRVRAIQGHHLLGYAYLGPERTFTEAALRTLPRRPAAPTCSPTRRFSPPSTPCVTTKQTRPWCRWRARSRAQSMPTLDELATGEPLIVLREVLLPVSFALLARPGTEPGEGAAGGESHRTRRRSVGAGSPPTYPTPSSSRRHRPARPRRWRPSRAER